MVKQLNGIYQVKSTKSAQYQKTTKYLMEQFDTCIMEKCLVAQNIRTDALARLASSLATEFLRTIPVEYPIVSSINMEMNLDLNASW